MKNRFQSSTCRINYEEFIRNGTQNKNDKNLSSVRRKILNLFLSRFASSDFFRIELLLAKINHNY